MAHELGHYLACVYYEVDATLPFFLPAPTPFTGTLGAFIRIRSAIYSKRVLFDIGVAGPLAGICVSDSGARRRPGVFESDSRDQSPGHDSAGRAGAAMASRSG